MGDLIDLTAEREKRRKRREKLTAPPPPPSTGGNHTLFASNTVLSPLTTNGSSVSGKWQ